MSVDEDKATLLDFFAGSGLVTAGLKPGFRTIWANDICPKKAAVYRANHSGEYFHLGPIEEVRGMNVPWAHLSWGSFPCQDLSLAGKLSGIRSSRSGSVWHWLRVMDEMDEMPPIAVAENVPGLVSAGQDKDYRDLHAALKTEGADLAKIEEWWVPVPTIPPVCSERRRQVIPNDCAGSFQSKAPAVGA